MDTDSNSVPSPILLMTLTSTECHHTSGTAPIHLLRALSSWSISYVGCLTSSRWAHRLFMWISSRSISETNYTLNAGFFFDGLFIWSWQKTYRLESRTCKYPNNDSHRPGVNRCVPVYRRYATCYLLSKFWRLRRSLPISFYVSPTNRGQWRPSGKTLSDRQRDLTLCLWYRVAFIVHWFWQCSP